MISAFSWWLVPARAEDWPSRPVRIVCTFAAGGAADILARIVADHLSTVFHQQFFVETRAGAGGAIGAQSVINTPPDGYNFVLVSVSLLSLIPVENPRLGFDPRRDLTNVAYVAGSPVVLSVNAASGMKTLADFVARAKASDKPLTFSSSGVGSMGHLVAELFARKAGLKFEHVPYKGASQGLTDLVGGHIAFSAQTVSSTSAQLKAGMGNTIIEIRLGDGLGGKGITHLAGVLHDVQAAVEAAVAVASRVEGTVCHSIIPIQHPELREQIGKATEFYK